MDNETLRLECLKIAVEENKISGLPSQKTIERAREFARFIFNPETPEDRVAEPHYDPKGRMEPRDIVSSKEGWSEFTLADGSVIRGKVVILDVKRAVGQFNTEGDPVYLLQMTMVNRVQAPDHLRKDNVT